MKLFNNINKNTYDLALVLKDFLSFYEFEIPYDVIKN